MKTCSKCKLEKPLVSFNKRYASKDGLMHMCKVCNRERSKAWRLANPEQHAATKKAWAAANKERKAATDKAWREANKERKAANDKAWYEANKDRAAASAKAWREANKERRAAIARRYKARKRCVVTEVDIPTDIDLIAAAGGVCAVCGETPDKWHIDHIWPISKGGPHVRENLQAICETCNISKNASLPDQDYPYPQWWDHNVVRACVQIALEEDEDGLLYFEPD